MGLLELVSEYAGDALNNVLAAFIILLIGFIIGKLAGRLIQKGLHEAELDKLLSKAGAKISFEHALSCLAEYFIYFITVIFSLNQLGITTIVLYIIAIAAMLILVISAFLGLKDFIPNFIAGLVIYRKGLVKEGFKISVNGVSGKVAKLTLLDTKIKTPKGDVIYIPNSVVVKSTIVHKRK